MSIPTEVASDVDDAYPLLPALDMNLSELYGFQYTVMKIFNKYILITALLRERAEQSVLQ